MDRAGIPRRHRANAPPGYRTTAEAYLAWGRANGGTPDWGTGATRGSLQFPWTVEDQPVRPLALLTTGSPYGGFAQLGNTPPFANLEQRQAYADKLKAIEGVTVPEDGLDRYPELAVGTLGSEPARTQFFDALDWFLEAIGRTLAPWDS